MKKLNLIIGDIHSIRGIRILYLKNAIGSVIADIRYTGIR